ncbi:hypothetical protein A2U01_0105223, partial [Trifolium medium]|nr:hypothetical protein [Trifolium medium]
LKPIMFVLWSLTLAERPDQQPELGHSVTWLPTLTDAR